MYYSKSIGGGYVTCLYCMKMKSDNTFLSMHELGNEKKKRDWEQWGLRDGGGAGRVIVIGLLLGVFI